MKPNALAKHDLRQKQYEGIGFRFRMGELLGLVMLIPVPELVQLTVKQVIRREDYQLESERPGNRLENAKHIERIKAGLKRHAQKLLLGSFIFAVDPGTEEAPSFGTEVLQSIEFNGGSYDIVRFWIYATTKFFILDAQHRNRALRELWDEVALAVQRGDIAAAEIADLLGQSCVPVLVVFEGDPDEISRMFVTMASTRPIPPSLIAVMDTEALPNRFGKAVALRARLLSDSDNVAQKLEFQRNAPGRDTLYTASAIRSAVASMLIGFRDRTPEARESNLLRAFETIASDIGAAGDDDVFAAAVNDVVAILDYAYDRLPGWRDLPREADDEDALSPTDFRRTYVHGASGGLYVIAGCLAAGRAAGIDPQQVVDQLSMVPWEKQAIVRAKGPAGETIYRHKIFEETLVITEPVEEEGGRIRWVAKTGGGNRTSYEKATRAVLHWLAKRDATLAEMVSPETLGEIGLAPRPGERRGRPRKS
jgi:hypothetical protein